MFLDKFKVFSSNMFIDLGCEAPGRFFKIQMRLFRYLRFGRSILTFSDQIPLCWLNSFFLSVKTVKPPFSAG